MSIEEKRTWIMGVVALVAYCLYLATVLPRAAATSLATMDYVGPLLWSIGGAIIAAIVLNLAILIGSPRSAMATDQRDKEINRSGEYIGQSFVVLGAISALILAMLEAPHAYIANVIYLGFVLSALLESAAKIVAYRRGFVGW